MKLARSRIVGLVIGGALLLVSSCTLIRGASDTVVYYSQAVHGQLGLLASRRGIDRVLADPATEEPLAQQLRLVQRLTNFAASDLSLPVDGRYGSYVDWRDSALVWNVIAAPEFSVDAVRRCYPIIGCVPYRGYFNRGMAEREAARLEADHDVIVAGASAYSTLGWFKDPVVSTFVFRSQEALAELIFHELAHGVVYVKGDAGFSEAFATFVGRQGASDWLAANGESALDWRQRSEDEIAFYAFLRDRRSRLAEVYSIEGSLEARRRAKAVAIDKIHSCYETNKDRLGAGRFDRVMSNRLDNARLSLLATYHELVPQFAALFLTVAEDWSRFYERVRELNNMPFAERRAVLRASLEASSEDEEDRGRDNHGADQIQCEPLAGHSLRRNPTG